MGKAPIITTAALVASNHHTNRREDTMTNTDRVWILLMISSLGNTVAECHGASLLMWIGGALFFTRSYMTSGK